MKPEDLHAKLIVSCQPVTGGPMDSAPFVVGFALAALAAGAGGLRVESADYVRAVRAVTDMPIIGLVKRDLDDSPVRITPFLEDVRALAEAGADIIAFDATDRLRPVSVADLIAAAKALGKLTMADCSELADAEHALALGVDFVGSTLSGYVGPEEPVDPDLQLLRDMRKLTMNVIAEGRIRTPRQAWQAAASGAAAVVVGSAITRTEHATDWFREAVEEAWRQAVDQPVLAIDIGGTKSMASLVSGARVIEQIALPTERAAGPDRWLAQLAEATAPWRGRYGRVALAVSGLVEAGRWSSLNTATLDIPDSYPLTENTAELFDAPAMAWNDAQAAAWGEYRHGAGVGSTDMVFLTVSTGIGGGVVLDGKLRTGLSGSFGLLRGTSDGAPLENQVTGRWLAHEAERAGHPGDAASVFAAADRGEAWALELVNASATRIAALCRDIWMTFDPQLIVIGGGIGLASGYLDKVRARLADLPPRQRPELAQALLGAAAGVVGAADLAAGRR